MNVVICANCGAENDAQVNFCKKCGSKLDNEGQREVSYESIPSTNRSQTTPATHSPIKIENKYTALRGIASLCRLLSYIFAGLAILGVLVGLISMFDSFLTGLAGIIASLIWGTVAYIFWQILAESISVLLDIEQNTRLTAAVLEQRMG